jgi:hypothetical protein
MPFKKGDPNINRAGRKPGVKPKEPKTCAGADVLADMLAAYGDPLGQHVGMRAIHQEMLRKDPYGFMKRLTELQARQSPASSSASGGSEAVPEPEEKPDEGAQRLGELLERLIGEFEAEQAAKAAELAARPNTTTNNRSQCETFDRPSP